MARAALNIVRITTIQNRRPKSNWREISLVQQYTLVKQIGKVGGK